MSGQRAQTSAESSGSSVAGGGRLQLNRRTAVCQAGIWELSRVRM